MIIDKVFKQSSYKVKLEGKRVASTMFHHPTNEELQFKKLLDDNKIKYSFHKLFFNSVTDGKKKYPLSYYVAQFWCYKKRLFVEIESKERDKTIRFTNCRTFDALEVFPKAQCIKLTKEDLNDNEFINHLLEVLKQK